LHLRWLRIGLRPWIAEAAANLPQQWRQQHWQLRHRLQCGSSSGGLHPNDRGSRAWRGRGRRCAQALPLRLALCPRGLGFALAACAMPLRLALRPCGLGFTLRLVLRATCSRLGLCPCGLALPSRLTISTRGLGCGGNGGGSSGSGSDGGKCLPSQLALPACRLGLCPCGSASPALPSRLALRTRGSASPKHNNQTAKQRPQKLLRQCCHLSAAAVAAGSSSASSCGGIGCGSVGGSVSVSGNGGGGGSGSNGGLWQQRWKWRRQ
jgi:hypothetical protein